MPSPRYLFLAVLITVLTTPVTAQPLRGGDSPIEISADNSLEWLQEDQQYVANGKVIVTQDTSKIFCDKLVADYRTNDITGNTEIWQLTAYDNVRLENDDSTVQGDKAVYNIDTGLSVITGNGVKLTTPEQTITASERMEYNVDKGIAKAIGNAKITRDTDTLGAKIITANFIKDKNGKQIFKTAHANNNVIIKTPDETITGSNGVYNAITNMAEIKGNVKIVRGPNTLEGARAEVNLTTNISKMFGEPNSGKRVKGVFFPSSKPKESKK